MKKRNGGSTVDRQQKNVEELNDLKSFFKFKTWAQHSGSHLFIFLRWIIFAGITGVVVGAAGAGFHHAIEWAGEFRNGHIWTIVLMPLAGLFIVWIYHVTDMSGDKGTEYVLKSVREATPLRLRTAPLIFASTVITHFVGGSAGREGAALQLGGSISEFIGERMRLNDEERRVIVMAGMSAGFAALFGTPLAAAVFAMEVVSVGVMYHAALVPCILSALIAEFVSGKLGVTSTSFTLVDAQGLSGTMLIKVIILGILCAAVSVLFCVIMHLVPKLYNLVTKNPYIKVVIGSGIMMLAVLLLGTDYCGAGMNIISDAVAGSARPEAFILKIILTAITLQAGFKGGEIVPAFFVGATFGAVIGPVIGIPAGFAAALGTTAVFCGVTNCPITSVILSFELFGGDSLMFFALCCAVSYMLSGYWSLYHEQKIMYSKTRAEFINRNTH